MQRTFALDNRNVGGLKVMSDQMYKHHKALIDVKPAINIKPPRPHVDHKKKNEVSRPVDLPMYKNKGDYNTVVKTFQTVIGMKKGRIDTNAPISMEMRKQLTGNLTKKEKFEQSEHLMNLKSQYKRIQSSNSMTERKKNQFDPIAHPARFFRREGQSVANIKIDKLMSHMTKEHRKLDISVDSNLTKHAQEHAQTKAIQKQTKPKRSQSAKPQKKEKPDQQSEKVEKQESSFVEEVPKVEGNSEKDYEILKEKIIRTIFKKRIYRTDDLESLFGRVLVHNPQLDLEIAELLFQLIRDEFEKE